MYSGDKHIPNAKNKGFWNAVGYSLHDDNSTSPQAIYLKNGELDLDFIDDDYVAPNDTPSLGTGKPRDDYVSDIV